MTVAEMTRRDARPTRRRVAVCAVALGALVLVALALPSVQREARWLWSRVMGAATVAQRLDDYGPNARARLRPHFAAAGIGYPPAEVVLIGIKDSKTLEVWAREGGSAAGTANEPGSCALIRTYPILAASGHAGPKLREGDRQVPEGVYAIESLNPNSRFHLSLRVNYPNAADRQRARADGRDNLGGDIMIHGGKASVGCLAMGDPAIEELFALVADAGSEHTEVILVPTDLRVQWPVQPPADAPAWTGELYEELRGRMSEFERPSTE